MSIHRTQNAFFAQFTEQISPASSEQSQAGVKSSLKRPPIKKKMTSERFVAEEHEQLLKRVKPQEANSFVHTPRSNNPAFGNKLRECFQRFDTLEKDIRFSKF